MKEELTQLFRMIAMGRPDAAEKVAEFLSERLEPKKPPIIEVEIPETPKRRKKQEAE
jgi:hypothetical protein